MGRPPGRPPSSKSKITIRLADRTDRIIKAVASVEGVAAAEKTAEYVRRYVNELIMKGEISADILEQAEEESDLQLLKDFLNALLDTGGHNGFSLAEIAEILGRESDQELVELLAKLKPNGNSQHKSTTKNK